MIDFSYKILKHLQITVVKFTTFRKHFPKLLVDLKVVSHLIIIATCIAQRWIPRRDGAVKSTLPPSTTDVKLGPGNFKPLTFSEGVCPKQNSKFQHLHVDAFFLWRQASIVRATWPTLAKLGPPH